MLTENLKIFAVVIGTLATFTLLANSIPQVQSEEPLNCGVAELATCGEILFHGGAGCVDCHGLGTTAPNLLTDHVGLGTIGVRCANRVPGEECKAYLYSSMVDPSAYLVDGFGPIMPDVRSDLSNQQIWALVAYLESVGGEVTVTGADVRETGDGTNKGAATAGAAAATASMDPVEIMTVYGCLECHEFDGGGAPIGPPFNGIGARVDADYIRESILDPAAKASEGFENVQTVMSPILGSRLAASQLEALVQFLASQR